jgi:hypothetical protein
VGHQYCGHGYSSPQQYYLLLVTAGFLRNVTVKENLKILLICYI